jgi:high affinity sulfate transporter 1
MAARPADGRRGAVRDIIAGVSLASMNVPQLLGYARIAGMPLAAGLYTALLAPIGFALFGSSRHLVVAADSGTAAILAGSLGHMAVPGSLHYSSLAATTALLTAAMLVVARVFRLGFLADFLSRTVLVGFLTGVGVQVSVAMLGDMAGIPVTGRGALSQLWHLVRGLYGLSLPTLGLSVLLVAAILLGRKFTPKIPIALVLVVATIGSSWGWNFAARGIATVGPIPGGLPPLGMVLPSWNESLQLLPIAASCFVVIIAQSAATARALAGQYNERLNGDDDILGLAAANAAAAITGAFVVNGSPTQTAMANRAGARSQLAQIVFAACVFIVLLMLTGPLQFLPRCVLAAIVFTIAIGMIDLGTLRAMRLESPGEFKLAVVTAAAVAIVGVEQGVLLAITLSLFRHVRQSYRPHTGILQKREQHGWLSTPATPGHETEPGLIIYRFGADLFYANATLFADEIRSLIDAAPDAVRWLVIEADAITNIDYTAARVVLGLIEELRGRKIPMLFARVSSSLRADMDRHGVTNALGADKIFWSRHEALATIRA